MSTEDTKFFWEWGVLHPDLFGQSTDFCASWKNAVIPVVRKGSMAITIMFT